MRLRHGADSLLAVLKPSKWCYACGTFCAVIAAIGIVLTTAGVSLVQGQLDAGLSQEFVLSSKSAGDFAAWASSENSNAAEIYMSMYIFNVTNAEDVASKGAKPVLNEVGPLTYRYLEDKYEFEWPEEGNGDLLQYRSWQRYVAADEVTRQLEAAPFVIPNIPLFGALHNVVLTGSYLVDLAVYEGVLKAWNNDSAAFITRTGHEVIWGWEDPVLTALNAFSAPFGQPVPTRFPGIVVNMTSQEEATASLGPNIIYTGKNTPALARQFLVWNAQDAMTCCAFGPCGPPAAGPDPRPAYPASEANLFNGGFGDQFHADVSSESVLRVSTHAFGIYRSWDLINTEPSYDVKGISLLPFRMDPATLGNETTSPQIAADYGLIDAPSGLLNQSVCEWGAKIFISKPHFLDGSNSLHDGVEGISPPSREAHDTYLGVEPYSGSTMDFHFRVQVVLRVEPDSFAGFSFFPNIANVYLPVAWADRYGTASDAQANHFKSTVYLATSLMAAARWGGVAAIVIGTILAAVFYRIGFKRSRDRDRHHVLATAKLYETLYAGETAGAGGEDQEGGISIPPSQRSSVVFVTEARRGSRASSRASSLGTPLLGGAAGGAIEAAAEP